MKQKAMDVKLVVRMTRKEACAKCRACSAGLKEQKKHLKTLNLFQAQLNMEL